MKAIDTSKEVGELAEQFNTVTEHEIELVLGEGATLDDLQLVLCRGPFGLELWYKNKKVAIIKPVLKESS